VKILSVKFDSFLGTIRNRFFQGIANIFNRLQLPFFVKEEAIFEDKYELFYSNP